MGRQYFMRQGEYIGCGIAFVVITLLPFFVYGDLYQAGEPFASGDMIAGFSPLLFSSASVWNGEGIPFCYCNLPLVYGTGEGAHWAHRIVSFS